MGSATLDLGERKLLIFPPLALASTGADVFSHTLALASMGHATRDLSERKLMILPPFGAGQYGPRHA